MELFSFIHIFQTCSGCGIISIQINRVSCHTFSIIGWPIVSLSMCIVVIKHIPLKFPCIISSGVGLFGLSPILTEVQFASGCLGLTGAGILSYIWTLSVCTILCVGVGETIAISDSLGCWIKILHLHPLASGALPLPLPEFKTLGFLFGHLNGSLQRRYWVVVLVCQEA